MNEITLNDLLNKIKEYYSGDLSIVLKSYDYAKTMHDGQFRDSGEPYIIHPLNVAYILAEEYCDIPSICGGLLHDVVEDTSCTLDDIKENFGEEIALLVDGVTNMSNIVYADIKEYKIANTTKLFEYMMKDIRCINIKIADRLHNMRTLKYKGKEKQTQKAVETMQIFVPFSNSLGAYRIKNELEDLCLKYLKNDEYERTLELYQKIDSDSKDTLTSMLLDIKEEMNKDNVNCNIKMRLKHIYGIYKRLNEGHKINDIHDLLNLKIMVENINECYLTLGRVHKLFHPINSKFKDYIYNPKTNMYQSLHTTVIAKDHRLVQAQIRTFDMDKIASFGLLMYWHLKKDKEGKTLQEEFIEKFQIYSNLKQLSSLYKENEEFVENVKKELLSEYVYVYSASGEIYELPKGSTIIDFAYKLGSDFGNKLSKAYVNDLEVPINYKLQNNDRILLEVKEESFPKIEWENSAKTTLAKKKIKDFNSAKNA